MDSISSKMNQVLYVTVLLKMKRYFYILPSPAPAPAAAPSAGVVAHPQSAEGRNPRPATGGSRCATSRRRRRREAPRRGVGVSARSAERSASTINSTIKVKTISTESLFNSYY